MQSILNLHFLSFTEVSLKNTINGLWKYELIQKQLAVEVSFLNFRGKNLNTIILKLPNLNRYYISTLKW